MRFAIITLYLGMVAITYVLYFRLIFAPRYEAYQNEMIVVNATAVNENNGNSTELRLNYYPWSKEAGNIFGIVCFGIIGLIITFGSVGVFAWIMLSANELISSKLSWTSTNARKIPDDHIKNGGCVLFAVYLIVLLSGIFILGTPMSGNYFVVSSDIPGTWYTEAQYVHHDVPWKEDLHTFSFSTYTSYSTGDIHFPSCDDGFEIMHETVNGTIHTDDGKHWEQLCCSWEQINDQMQTKQDEYMWFQRWSYLVCFPPLVFFLTMGWYLMILATRQINEELADTFHERRDKELIRIINGDNFCSCFIIKS